jgi:hypothetical protein
MSPELDGYRPLSEGSAHCRSLRADGKPCRARAVTGRYRCAKHGGLLPSAREVWESLSARDGRRFEGARITVGSDFPEIPAVISRRGLMDLGFSETSVDAILRQVPVVALPGSRRLYMRCRDVAACIDAYLYDGTTIRPTSFD